MDLVAARVNGADESASPSSGAPSPSMERQQPPSPLEQTPKRVCCTPTATTSVAPKEDDLILKVVSLQSGPSEAMAGCSGSSTLLTGLQKGPPVPCHIPELVLPATAFSHVNLKGSGKMFLCEECTKSTSNQDTMVSHYLQEHLRIPLGCPQCGMSYSDPSKFHHHGRELHNLLFH